MKTLTKTYLWANTTHTDFPPEFVGSKNKRFIVIERCKAIYNDTLIGDIIMHADLIERDHYCDYAAMKRLYTIIQEHARRDNNGRGLRKLCG